MENALTADINKVLPLKQYLRTKRFMGPGVLTRRYASNEMRALS